MSAVTKITPAKPAPKPAKPEPAATFTAREFNQDLARAKRATAEGPVVITDRGRPAHVLMSYEEYENAFERSCGKNALEILREALIAADVEGVADIELKLPKRAVDPQTDPFD